jgi:hypothetical protein
MGDDGFASPDTGARVYLKTFSPQSYPAYYRRTYDPYSLLEEIGIWRIAEMVQQNWSLQKIAQICDISLYALRRWLREDESRVEVLGEAKLMAGENYAYKAEAVIETAANDFELKKADKLANHYRWMAERLNREEFGQQVKVQNTHAPAMSFHFDLSASKKGSVLQAEAEDAQLLAGETLDLNSLVDLLPDDV